MHFTLDGDGFWVADVGLPSWAGYLDRSGYYGGAGERAVSDGSVRIQITSESGGDDPPTHTELALAQWFVDNEPTVSMAVRDAILSYLREHRGVAPDVQTTAGLKACIGLHTVHVHPTEREDLPYLGFELGCTWDEEHGLGVLMHGMRLVSIGGSDIAILLWMAEEDARRH